MTIRCAVWLAMACVLPMTVAAQTELPPPAEQVRLALSAAPPQVRPDAGVMVLGRAGYEIEQPSSNGFWCLLERWERENVTPICYDRVGVESTLRVVKYLEQRRSAGAADSTIYGEIDAGYADGTYSPPRGWGVAYMLSPEGPAPPHVMYYAPYARNDDFGGAGGAARRVLPFIYDEGTPRAYIVQLVDPAAWARIDGRAERDSSADR